MRPALLFLKVALFLSAPALPGDNAPGLPLGITNWGNLTQDGPKLAINGHSYWCASGEIRQDGKIYLLWQINSDGRLAPSLYERKGDKLVGLWGWDGSVEFDREGELVGTTMGDTIWKR